jgi:predicted MFS family arabinose efflux permease
MTPIRASLGALFSGFREPVVPALGITQTIGYGTLYYAYGVLAPAIAVELDVPIAWFFGIFSVGLLLGGLVAPLIGRMLDAHGARIILTLGSLAASGALLFCSIAPNIWLFGVGVILVEIAACMVLYETAFGGLTQIYRHEARRRITAVTLVAGFASTVFWPFTQLLLETVGWRSTFVIFAIAHLVICLPLHWRMLRAATPLHRQPERAATDAPEPLVLVGTERQRAVILYTISVCISGLVYSSVSLHMLGIIEGEGFSSQDAALIAMAMGPAQVLARMVEAAFGRRFDALTTGRFALIMLTVAPFMLLAFSGSLYATIIFAVCHGLSSGLISIARGTVPLQLFGAKGYGALVGRITGWRFLVNAAAPFAFSLAATLGGMSLAVGLNGAAALLSLGAFLLIRAPKQALAATPP